MVVIVRPATRKELRKEPVLDMGLILASYLAEYRQKHQ